MPEDFEKAVPRILENLLSGVSEAFGMVSGLGEPNSGESLADLHERLLTTRAAMSRVSELNSQLIRLQGRVRSVAITKKGELEEAESKALLDEPKRTLVEDYSSAKERNAKLAAKTIQERRNVRAMDQLSVDLDSALEYGKNRLWELDRSVRDIDTRLRILSYEPNVR